MERYLTDRTSIETDWECGEKYALYKLEGGQGVVPVEEARHFADGRAIHDALFKLAQADDPVACARTLVADGRGVASDAVGDSGGRSVEHELGTRPTTADRESRTRLEGWITAWAHYLEPRIRATHESIGLEQELIFQRDPLWVATTPDRILRDRSSGQIIVDDYKTFGGSMGWAAHWPYAVQIHIQLKAVEEELNIKPAYGRVRGLVKGQWQKGRLYHPYVYGYTDKSGSWFTEHKPGLQATPVWEYPGGIEEWVLRHGEEVGLAQFPLSQPIFLNERLLARLVAERIARHREIARWQALPPAEQVEQRPIVFPMRFKNCRPIGGSKHPCPYLAACHNATVNADPLGSGLYIPRTPHHELEIIGVDDDAE